MAEFAVHIRASEETTPERAEQLLEPYVSEHEEVSYGEESIQDTGGTGFVPEQSCLLVDGVELLADIYTDLQSHPDVAKVILGGPGSERFPVPVQHYALQQLEYPDLYEYHALDGKGNARDCRIADGSRESARGRSRCRAWLQSLTVLRGARLWRYVFAAGLSTSIYDA